MYQHDVTFVNTGFEKMKKLEKIIPKVKTEKKHSVTFRLNPTLLIMLKKEAGRRGTSQAKIIESLMLSELTDTDISAKEIIKWYL